MRTTLTLDEDVAAKLKAEIRRTGKPMKTVVNESLRVALTESLKDKPVKPFKVHARPLGLRPGLSFDNVWKLIEEIEGENYK